MPKFVCKKCNKNRPQDDRMAKHKYCVDCGMAYSVTEGKSEDIKKPINPTLNKILHRAKECISLAKSIQDEIFCLYRDKEKVENEIDVLNQHFDSMADKLSPVKYYKAEDERFAVEENLKNRRDKFDYKIRELLEEKDRILLEAIGQLLSFLETNDDAVYILPICEAVLDLMSCEIQEIFTEEHGESTRDLESIYMKIIEYLKQVIVEYPNRANAYYDLAVTYRNKNDKDIVQSIIYMDKAIALNNNDVRYYNLKGLLLLDKQEPKSALVMFDRAISLDQKDLMLYLAHKKFALDELNVLNYAIENGLDYDNALFYLDSIEEHQYKEEEKIIKMGEDVRGMYEDALHKVNVLIENDPKSALYHHNRGSILQILGRGQEACDAFSMASKLDPSTYSVETLEEIPF